MPKDFCNAPKTSYNNQKFYLKGIVFTYSGTLYQGSRNSEIWIGPAHDDDIINEPISKVLL